MLLSDIDIVDEIDFEGLRLELLLRLLDSVLRGLVVFVGDSVLRELSDIELERDMVGELVSVGEELPVIVSVGVALSVGVVV